MAVRKPRGGARQSAGRKPVDANGRRDKQIAVLLSAKELAEIRRAAGSEAAGAWARRKLLEIARRMKKRGRA